MFARCLLLALLLALGLSDHVRCQTTQGDLLIELFPEVAPLGVARFRAMVGAGFYREVGFTRNIEGFLTQFGVQAGGAENDAFGDAIKDDPPCKEGAIKRGVLSFAGRGPHTRSNQLWFGYCGSAVCPGVVGDNPVIARDVDIDAGVPMQYDFRDVYATVLADWFEVDEALVADLLFKDFRRLPIFCNVESPAETPTPRSTAGASPTAASASPTPQPMDTPTAPTNQIYMPRLFQE